MTARTSEPTLLDRMADIVAREGIAVRVVIVATAGPTPRAEGASMLVSRSGHVGRVGREEVLPRVLTAARRLIEERAAAAPGSVHWLRQSMCAATGEVLGVATGGEITLLLEAYGPAEMEELMRQASDMAGPLVLVRSTGALTPAAILSARDKEATGPIRECLTALDRKAQAALVWVRAADDTCLVVERISPQPPPFLVYGTGLVARALVKLLVDLPFDVRWIDIEPGHFPTMMPENVDARTARDLPSLAGKAGPGAFHAVMTNDHAIDLAVCRAVLAAGQEAYLGAIGSRLKRSRMETRLRRDGIDEAQLARLCCPIGLPGIRSKDPAVIAVAIAAEALGRLHPPGSTVTEGQTAAGTKR